MASSKAEGGDLPLQILHALDKTEPLHSAEAFPEAGFVDMKAAVDKLRSREMVRYDTIEREEALLEPEGELIAERAKAAGVDAVVFDRSGNKYHGRVAAVADGAREAGLAL